MKRKDKRLKEKWTRQMEKIEVRIKGLIEKKRQRARD